MEVNSIAPKHSIRGSLLQGTPPPLAFNFMTRPAIISTLLREVLDQNLKKYIIHKNIQRNLNM